MHIKHIHDMVEKLSECAKCELDKGIEQIDTKEMGEVAEIIKELSEAEYYAKISKAMDEAEYGEDYDYMGAYDEHERKGYRGQPRDSMGRFRSRRGRRGGRMGYEETPYLKEPPYWHMTPEMYREHEPEYWRDMDKYTMGKMYYTDETNTNPTGSMQSMGGQYSARMQNVGRDSREGRSGEKRKGYMEAKEHGKEKGEKMKELEAYMKSMAEDLTEAIEGATPEERAMAKNKLSVLVSKM